MSDAPQKRTNSLLWLGLFFFLLAILANVVSFFHLTAAWLTWLALALPSLAILAAMLCAGSVAFFIGARAVPRSAGAPQVGQRVPDFTLPDSTGQPVSLSQLCAPRLRLAHLAGFSI